MKILSFLLLALLLSSCTSNTNRLWKNSTYTEIVSAFLITENGQKLAVIGKKYHYIFKLDNSLKNILLSKERSKINSWFHSFKVDDDNNVSGRFSLVYINKNNNVEIEKLGFKSSTYKKGKKTRYSFKGSINGQRYTTKKDINTNYKFNRPHAIKVEEPHSFLGKLGRILATPIAVGIDGVHTIVGVSLIPVLGVVVIAAN